MPFTRSLPLSPLLPLYTLLCFILVGTVAAQAEETAIQKNQVKDTALQYISAYPYADPEKLAAFYTEETQWYDPTFDKDTVTGKEAIMAFLKKFVEGSSKVEFTPELRFTSGDYAVFHFTLAMSYPGKVLESKQEQVDISGIEGVSILKIKDGKVLEHLDFTNIDEFNRQWAAAKSN